MDWDEFTADIEKAVSARLDTLQSNIDTHHQSLKSTISKLNSFTQLLQEKLPGGLFPINETKTRSKLLSPTVETPKSNRASSKDSKSFQIDHKETPNKSEEAKKRLEDNKKKKEEEDLRKKEMLAKKKEEDDKKKEENKKKLEEVKEKKKQEEADKKHKIEEEKERKKQEEAEKKHKIEEDKRAAEEQKAKKKQAEEEKRKKTGEIQRKSSEEPRKITHNAAEDKKQETNKSKIGQPRGLKPPSTIPKPNSRLAAQKSPLRTPPKPESPVPAELPTVPKPNSRLAAQKSPLRTPPKPESPVPAELPVVKNTELPSSIQKEPEIELIIEETRHKQESLPQVEKEPEIEISIQIDTEKTDNIKSPVLDVESPSKKTENLIEHSSYSNRRSSFNISESSIEKPGSDNQSEISKQSLKLQKRSSFSVTLNSSSDDILNSSLLYRQNTDPSILVESLTRSVISPQITLEEISIQLQLLEGHYQQSDLNTEKKFDLSVGAKSALSLLTTMDEDKFHLNHIPREEVIWSFRLFFRFIGRNLNENSDQAWAECQEFLRNTRDREFHKKSVDKVVLDVINNFDFSDENIDKVEEMIVDKEQYLQPQYYTEMCPITGLFMFAIREASIYAGVIKGKIPVWRQYKRLLHKRQRLLVN